MFNRKVLSLLSLVLLLVGSTISAQAAPGLQRGSVGPVEVSGAVHSDVSAPLRDLNGTRQPGGNEKKDKPLRILPNMGNALNQKDGAVQSSAGPLVGTTNSLNFAGVGNGDYGFAPDAAPPDTNGAVGATQYVQWVNESFAVYDKTTGARTYGPAAGNTLFQALGSTHPCAVHNDGDPIAQYDKAAGRWLLTQFSVTSGSTQQYWQCVAVSKTSDATGAYNVYAFPYGTVKFNDYPKVGVWNNGYYFTYNIFNNGSTFAGTLVCAMDRTAMLNGAAATQVCFQTSTAYGGLLPADIDGLTPPPA